MLQMDPTINDLLNNSVEDFIVEKKILQSIYDENLMTTDSLDKIKDEIYFCS
jgi:hypothetical protein